MRSRTASTICTDERDSRQKRAFALFTAETNPDLAVKMAEAIAKDVSLLSGLTKMVTKLCMHEKARVILGKVFEDQAVARKFSHAYKAYVGAELFN